MKRNTGAVRKKKKKDVRGKSPGQRVIFCTACGSTLENFCFSSKADDLKAIRKTLAQCKSTGRFSGEFCSKLFIAHPEALDDNDKDD